MNKRIFDGYLPAASDAAYARPAPEAAAVRKVLFDVMVKQAGGTEFVEKCCIESLALQREAEHNLVAGAFVEIEGEVRARPYVERGVVKGFTRDVVVFSIKFLRVPKSAIGGVG